MVLAVHKWDAEQPLYFMNHWWLRLLGSWFILEFSIFCPNLLLRVFPETLLEILSDVELHNLDRANQTPPVATKLQLRHRFVCKTCLSRVGSRAGLDHGPGWIQTQLQQNLWLILAYQITFITHHVLTVVQGQNKCLNFSFHWVLL